MQILFQDSLQSTDLNSRGRNSHNPVVSGLPELGGRTSHRAIEDGKHRAPFVMEPAFDNNCEQQSPTNEPEEARPFSLIRILWITVYALMLLAFDWEAGFQFNASPSTVNRTLAGALSVIGFAFCIKMVWKELTERRGQGCDEA
jgi:hypothetical protein